MWFSDLGNPVFIWERSGTRKFIEIEIFVLVVLALPAIEKPNCPD